MTGAERAEIVVTARLLRASSALRWLGLGLTILAGLALVRGVAIIAATVALSLGVIATYFSVRVALDAHLFDDIAAGRLSNAELDEALVAFGRRTAPRAWSDRCRGARSLVMRLAMATIAESAAVIWIGWSSR